MKKEELSIFMKALIPTIKKTIKLEVKKIVKPLIKEEVQSVVNKMLAEQFLQTVTTQKKFLTESMEPSHNKVSEAKVNEEEKRKREAARLEMRKEMMRKLGADQNPMLEMIYEDVSDRDLASAGQKPVSVGGQAIYVDDDDEGVDLSLLGL